MPLFVVAEVMNDDIIRDVATFQASGDWRDLSSAILRFAHERKWSVPELMLETSIHFEEGAKKYGENNWQKGIPTKCYIDSAVRHYLKWRKGDTDEPHDRAFVWNLLCCMWEVQREK